MRSILLLILLSGLSGCSTQYYVHLQKQNYSGDLLNVSQRCLAMSGFDNYTQLEQDWERHVWAAQIGSYDSLVDIWFGDYMYIDISNYSGDWTLSFIAHHYYDEYAVIAKNDFVQCIHEEYPGIDVKVMSYTGLDFR